MNTVDTLINLSPPAHRQPSSRVVQSMTRIEERSLVDDSRPTKGRLIELQPWCVCVCHVYVCVGPTCSRRGPTRRNATLFDAGPTKGRQRNTPKIIHTYIYICRDIQNVDVCIDTRNYRSACSPAAALASLPLAPQRSTCLKSFFSGTLEPKSAQFF